MTDEPLATRVRAPGTGYLSGPLLPPPSLLSPIHYHSRSTSQSSQPRHYDGRDVRVAIVLFAFAAPGKGHLHEDTMDGH
jgi:hypothetical protein